MYGVPHMRVTACASCADQSFVLKCYNIYYRYNVPFQDIYPAVCF